MPVIVPPSISIVSISSISRTFLKPIRSSTSLQRRVLQAAAAAAGHDHGADLVAQLEQRLEQHVVLMVVGDHHVVDTVRQVGVGVAREVAW